MLHLPLEGTAAQPRSGDTARHPCEEDYGILRDLGIAVAREGISWPLVDRNGDQNGRYDFSSLDPLIAAMNAAQVIPIWDLCHYGYPDDLDPFSESFTPRFAAYCRAVAEYAAPRLHDPYFFTPVNEITYFAFIGGEWGWVAPHRKTREERYELRLALCWAAISSVRAIREVLPEARMIHIDPLIQVVAPQGRPDLVQAAGVALLQADDKATHQFQAEAR